jgi:hypothetical protein
MLVLTQEALATLLTFRALVQVMGNLREKACNLLSTNFEFYIVRQLVEEL